MVSFGNRARAQRRALAQRMSAIDESINEALEPLASMETGTTSIPVDQAAVDSIETTGLVNSILEACKSITDEMRMALSAENRNAVAAALKAEAEKWNPPETPSE